MESERTQIDILNNRINFENTEKRKIDPDNDIYPPLLSNGPSRKVTGFNRILFSIWYLEINRLRELLLEEPRTQSVRPDPWRPRQNNEIIYETDEYGRNIIATVCVTNYPTNMNYDNNKEKYDKILFVTLTTLNKKTLDKLFSDLHNQCVPWGKKVIEALLEELENMPLLFAHFLLTKNEQKVLVISVN
jgi:hypothetical protein